MDNERDLGSDHGAHVSQAVGSTLALLYRREACVLVRRELSAALQRLVSCYDSNFAAIAFRFWEKEKSLEAVQQPTGKTRPKMAIQGKGHRMSVDLPANFSAMRQGEENDKNWFECGPRKLCPVISARLHLEGGWRLHHHVEGAGCWYECKFAFRYIFFS